MHTCGRTRAVVKAQSFVTGADLSLGVGDDPLLGFPGVASALAVLAGIAAADAACLHRGWCGHPVAAASGPTATTGKRHLS